MKRSTVQRITKEEFETQASQHTAKALKELFRSEEYKSYINSRQSMY
jgi:hypothetical protein